MSNPNTTTPTLRVSDLTFEVHGSDGAAAVSGKTGDVDGYDLVAIGCATLDDLDHGGPMADSDYPDMVDRVLVQPIYDVIGAVFGSGSPGGYEGAASLQFLLEARDNLDKAIREYHGSADVHVEGDLPA